RAARALLRDVAARVAEEEADRVRVQRPPGERGTRAHGRAVAPLEARARELEACERGHVVEEAPGGPEREHRPQTAAVAHLVARGRAEALDRLPGEAEVRAVEALAVAGEVEAALVAEVERELLINRKPVREADDGEAVRAVDAVLDLVARVEVGEVTELRL